MILLALFINIKFLFFNIIQKKIKMLEIALHLKTLRLARRAQNTINYFSDKPLAILIGFNTWQVLARLLSKSHFVKSFHFFVQIPSLKIVYNADMVLDLPVFRNDGVSILASHIGVVRNSGHNRFGSKLWSHLSVFKAYWLIIVRKLV